MSNPVGLHPPEAVAEGKPGGNAKVWCVVPTFREPAKLAQLLASFRHVAYAPCEVLVVNANPGDETSKLLTESGDARFQELPADPSLFWSGLVNVGLRQVLAQASTGDYVALVNADVTFQEDVVDALVDTALRLGGRCQVGALTLFGDRVRSSGVVVRSWMFALNCHPLAGQAAAEVPRDALVSVDFLPTRFTLLPVIAARAGGLAHEQALPHYGADYEMTNRLRCLGYQPYITGTARVSCDMNNTGNSSFDKQLNFRQRLASMISIKSTYNPIIRLKFIWLVYPPHARPTASVSYLVKSMVEIVCGGAVVRKLLPGTGHGFSR